MADERVGKSPQAKDALRRSEERFRNIFEHSNDAIFVIDPAHGEILEANPVRGLVGDGGIIREG